MCISVSPCAHSSHLCCVVMMVRCFDCRIDGKSHTKKNTPCAEKRANVSCPNVSRGACVVLCAQSHIQISEKLRHSRARPLTENTDTHHILCAGHVAAAVVAAGVSISAASCVLLLRCAVVFSAVRWTCVCMLLAIIKVAFVSIKQTTARRAIVGRCVFFVCSFRVAH